VTRLYALSGVAALAFLLGLAAGAAEAREREARADVAVAKVRELANEARTYREWWRDAQDDERRDRRRKSQCEVHLRASGLRCFDSQCRTVERL
jgi:uncharacterized protein HemY